MERLKLELAPGQASNAVTIKIGDRVVTGAAWPSFGHPDNSVTVTLGYGRTRMGNLANGAGYNANLIRTADAPWLASGAQITADGRQNRHCDDRKPPYSRNHAGRQEQNHPQRRRSLRSAAPPRSSASKASRSTKRAKNSLRTARIRKTRSKSRPCTPMSSAATKSCRNRSSAITPLTSGNFRRGQ